MVNGLDGDPMAFAWINEPVRLYRPRDQGAARLDVVVLTGDLAGRRALVHRNMVLDDGNGYVKTEQELTTLAAAMAAEGFFDENGVFRSLPFLAGRMYCWARAYEMAKLLKASGYQVGKFLLIDYDGMRVDSIYGDDMPDLHGATGYTWQWHIAPVVFLGDSDGPFVLDPSLLPTATQAGPWVARMNIPTPDFLFYDDMVTRLLQTKRYPVVADMPGLQVPWLVLADDGVLEPPNLSNPQKRIDAASEDPRNIAAALGESWDSLPQRYAVGALNTLRNNWLAAVGTDDSKRRSDKPYEQYQADLATATQQFHQLNDWYRSRVWKKYPILLQAVRKTFAGTGVQNDIAALLEILTDMEVVA